MRSSSEDCLGGTARVLAIACALPGVLATPAVAQTRNADGWPQRPIRMIVDFSAGGLSDTMVRAVAPRMSEALGQPIVMDNRPGAAGALAYSLVAKAVPDGHTLVTLSTGFSLNVSLVAKLPFDTVKDFTPIGLIGTTPNVLVANPKTAKTVAELIAYVKARPGTTNAASTPHLTLELLRRATGIDATHVPFNGSGPALTDLIGSRIDFMFVNLPASIGHIRGGRINALAVGSEQRSAQLPEVPTMQEAGYKGFRSVSWAGIGGPAGLPKPVLARLSRELIAAIDNAEVRERIAAAGGEPRATTPEQFRAFIDDEIKRWGRVIREAGIKVEG